MRVALAEDSGIFRQALVALLRAVDVTVTAAAVTGEEVLPFVTDDPPDVVILDMHMPPTFTNEGVIAARRIKADHPGTGVLVLSAYNETPQAVALLDGNLRGVGYLLKDHVSDVATLRDALHRIAMGEVVIDPHIVARLVDARRRACELDALSGREREVLSLMAEGYSNAGLAHRMHLSARTVEDHVRAIFAKLGVNPDNLTGNPQDGNKRVLAVLTWLRAVR